MKHNTEVSQSKWSGRNTQKWKVDRTEAEAEAEGAVGKKVTEVETKGTVLGVNAGEEGGEATNVAAVKETTTAAVDAEEAPMLRSSITG